MTINRTRITEQSSGQQGSSIADLIDRLSRFDGPPDQFLVNLLAVQCAVGLASGGAFVRATAEGRPEVLAVYPSLPEGTTAPTWLAQAVESLPQVAQAGTTIVRPVRMADELYGAAPEKFLILLPIRSGNVGVRGTAAFFIETTDGEVLQASRQRLELTLSLLSLYEMRLTLQHRQFDLQRLRQAMEVLAAVNEPERFTAVGMALCNELSSRWQCHRVSLGFLKGRYVQMKALSHTEKFSRKMKLVQDIEAAMEECLDQDVEVIVPSAPDATYVSRATAELSRQQGPASILSLPLRRAGEVIGVIALERPQDKPFKLDEVESLRLTCDLATARIEGLYENDRWFGARLARSLGKGMGTLLGPKHTWLKVGAIAILGLIVFLIFAKGDYQAEGSFVIQTVQRQIVSAQFDAKLNDVPVDIGQSVKAGDVLAVLDTRDLQEQLTRAETDYTKFVTQAQEAERLASIRRDDAKTAEARSLRAQAAGALASIEWTKYNLERAVIKAPIDGVVVSGDWKRQVGKPFKTGDPMFEIAPLDAVRAEISIPEDQIGDIDLTKRGELVTRSEPGRRIPFRVERINPIAELEKQNNANIFKVRVTLEGVDPAKDSGWLRPGVEGLAKIDIDRRNYGFLWSRRLVNWIRMQMWI
jgi:multidrug resistance efflux pump